MDNVYRSNMAVSGSKVHHQFSSTFLRSPRKEYEIFCQPCDCDNIRLPAFGFCMKCQEYLCESCFNHHKRTRPSRHHILLDKHNMPQNLHDPSKSYQAGQADEHTTPCLKHKKEMIKFYCNYHRALLCSVCVSLDHTGTSCRVDYMPDISKHSLVDNNEYTKSLHKMDTVIQKYQEIIEDLKKKTTAANHSLTDVLQEIKKFRQEINQRLDELEKEAEDMAKARQQENEQRLKTAEAIVDDVTKSLNASSNFIKQLNDSKQADKLFMELKQAEQLIKDNEKKISLLALPKDVGECYFKENPAIASCLQKEMFLGTLIAFSHQEVICVKTPQDLTRCWITGITHHTPSKLILTDFRNDSVKMINLNNSSITNQLQLDTVLWDITSITSDQVAVTLPYMETIQFISASPNKLSLKHKLKANGRCRGISCYHVKLAVTFLSPGKLQILNLNGKVLSTVTTDRSGKDSFSEPHYVTSNSHSIYVSDAGKHAVIRLNWLGELTASYGGMGTPRGLTMLEDGSILVCDYLNDNIQHISADLAKGNVVLRDLKSPHTICWCGTNSKQYISHDSRDEKYDNFI